MKVVTSLDIGQENLNFLRKEYPHIEFCIYNKIENIWLNQNIILNSTELDLLNDKGYKYIPNEFFGKELKEVAE